MFHSSDAFVALPLGRRDGSIINMPNESYPYLSLKSCKYTAITVSQNSIIPLDFTISEARATSPIFEA